jgi:hypothetical protein
MQILLPDNIPTVVKASSTSLTLATTYLGQPTLIRVGGQQYTPSSTITLNTGTVGFNGIDTGALAANTLYYIYAVVQSSNLGMIISTTGPSTGPTGFTSAFKLLGRVRTDFGAANLNTVAMDANIAPQGAGGTEWTSYTPTLKGTTNGSTFTNQTTTGKWRQAKDAIEVQVRTVFSGTPGVGTGNMFWTLPNNLTIDANKLVSGSGAGNLPANTSLVYCVAYNANSNINAAFAVYETTGGTNGFIGVMTKQAPINTNYLTSSFPAAFANGDYICLNTSFPIAEWAGLYS